MMALRLTLSPQGCLGEDGRRGERKKEDKSVHDGQIVEICVETKDWG